MIFDWNKLKEKNNRKGSILLEALLSVVILSVSITLIIQSMTSSYRATVYNADYTTAFLLIENKLFEVIQKGYLEAGLREEKNFLSPYEKYKYLLSVNPYQSSFANTGEDPADQNHLNRIDLKLSWSSGKRKNNILLKTLLFNSLE